MRSILMLLSLGAALPALAQDQPVAIFGTTVVSSSGLRGLVYHIHHSKQLPDFEKLRPAGPAIYTSSLNIPPQDFSAGFPGVTKRNEWFAIDYTGGFWITEPGGYTFSLLADDGAKLWIDDRLVVDNDGLHVPQEKAGAVELSGGRHGIRVSYFQGPKFQIALVLKVSQRGGPFRVFSTEEFKPPPDAGEWRVIEKTGSTHN